jgi:predicted RNA methylase
MNSAPEPIAPTIAAQHTTCDNGSVKKVSPPILALLSRARAEGTAIYINTGSLDRKTYEQVDAIMKKMGGKWDKRQRAHVFPFDPAEKLDLLLMAGVVEIPENYGHFPTPPPFAQGTIIPLANLKPGMQLFEPEAGTGNLADAAAAIVGKQNVVCCELQEKNQQLLRDKGYHVIPGDFLSLPPDPVYPRIIMNPPFAHFQDIAHVTHALKFLQPQGRLVSIMSGGITFREDRRTKEFRELVQALGGDITENPVRTFKESGTDCQTITVTIQTQQTRKSKEVTRMKAEEIIVDRETYFDIAEGLYWFCSDYHGGQYSYFYQAKDMLKFRPSPVRCQPESDMAWSVYKALEEQLQVSEQAAESAVAQLIAKVKDEIEKAQREDQ